MKFPKAAGVDGELWLEVALLRWAALKLISRIHKYDDVFRSDLDF